MQRLFRRLMGIMWVLTMHTSPKPICLKRLEYSFQNLYHWRSVIEKSETYYLIINLIINMKKFKNVYI
eukprot:UN13610